MADQHLPGRRDPEPLVQRKPVLPLRQCQLYLVRALSLQDQGRLLPLRGLDRRRAPSAAAHTAAARPTAAELVGNQVYTVPRDYTFGRVDLHGYPCGLISEFYTCPAAISKMTFYADEQWVSRYSGSLLEFGATFPLPLQKGISLVLSRTIGHRDPLSSFGVLQSNKVVETDLALTVSFP